jgi:hypothetical protein
LFLIGPYSVDKKIHYQHTFQGHRDSEFISNNIAKYLFQYIKNCTRQDLQYTAQEMKDFETRKILATLQMSKYIFPSDRLNDLEEAFGY